MRPLSVLALGFGVAISAAACGGPPPGTLEAATAALGSAEIRAVEYSGTGRWFQFGQAPNPTLPWPAFEVSRFTAAVDYQQPAARVEMVRRQVVEPLQAVGIYLLPLAGTSTASGRELSAGLLLQ